MHNLTGCFVKQIPQVKEIAGRNFYIFKIIFTNRSREFYVDNKYTEEIFIDALYKRIGYK